ncbi:hypothetical protein LEP1GSC199_1855 [Leptospira vanthielii serovar Holland str. Waz Holland = ATCC 700522]|uniref:Uncharacterized protein n=1 Tax=Leptospira vanthielii serovar Holland str. Waz Holland = ATCC 700522 TaxID=1218591 RepID=N1W662_9LEPT|nr:hypothetical protein LEP1GSC199_1855 [Leptospira vanthielii serovar Holland str. Waz Holland = ATCC 700522]
MLQAKSLQLYTQFSYHFPSDKFISVLGLSKDHPRFLNHEQKQ